MSQRTSTVWIENTSSQFEHGGEGWALGQCVWCPTADRRGAGGKYGIIKELRPGDRVIHCYDSNFLGTSEVAEQSRTVTDRPPNVGSYGFAAAFHRVELREYRPLSRSSTVRGFVEQFSSEIRGEIESTRPKYYLFSWQPPGEYCPAGKLSLSQGRFLARCTPALLRLIQQYVPLDSDRFGSADDGQESAQPPL